MFNKHRKIQREIYLKARDVLASDSQILMSLEEYFTNELVNLLKKGISSFKTDYDEASYLYPFWQHYPPDERGRLPRGDQYPWIEVGEHAIGDKAYRLFAEKYSIRDIGIPTGPDKRFVLSSPEISKLTKGLTDSIWLFIDIKSVGPRDNFDHAVMSHNQISGDGHWENIEEGVVNTVMMATGKHQKHLFHCSVPPLYVLSDETILPVINVVIKPIYKMLSLDIENKDGGQPLDKIKVISIPNGILMEENPGYLKKYPSLLFPGKDDKGKNPLKIRSRVSFQLLREIAPWRVQEVLVD